MRIICICALIASVVAVCLQGSAQSFRWNEYRYLAVCEQPVDGQRLRFVEPARALVNSAAGQERRLALIAITADRDVEFVANGEESSDSLRKEVRRVAFNTRCNSTDNYVDLIGLDGQTKMTWREAFPDPDDLFALIDSMPMRRREIAEQSE